MNKFQETSMSYYTKLDKVQISGTNYDIWYSTNEHDEFWDEFVYSIKGSSYEQMSLWAQVKSLEGWKFIRVVIASEDSIVGGFQILWKKKRFLGKIGYMSKGPLINRNDRQLELFIFNLIRTVAESNKISALLTLPFNKYNLALECPDFLPNRLVSVIEATTVIDLTQEEDVIKKKMPYMRRKNIKIAASSGAILREGNKSELNLFFTLMLETCKRQNVYPNPPTYEILKKIWERFSLTNKVKLFFLEFENRIITGCFVFLYQDKFYAWKIGWSGEEKHIKPNDAIHWMMILWAKKNYYKYYDFGSVDIDHVEIVQKNESIPAEMRSTPSYFKLSFGGEIVNFPKAGIYISNPFLRILYKIYLLTKNFF